MKVKKLLQCVFEKPRSIGMAVVTLAVLLLFPVRLAASENEGQKTVIEQQTGKTVTGTVKDNSGEPVIGANIKEKGTTNGIVTDADGNFSLNVADNAVLQVSYIGYVTQEVNKLPKDGKSLLIILLEDTQALDEVVVIGYGTTTKADLSSSVVTANERMLSAVNTVNMVDGLQGKLPGLNIKQRTNEPGAYTTAFSVRGFGTPLIVIDGIVRDEFFKLDPNSIKSISVLKDAAAAVYGVKAANGVVLITTKDGNANQKPTIQYSGRMELNTVTNANNAKACNAYQYATQIAETDVYLGRTPTYTREDLQNFKDGTYPSTDWLDVTFNNQSWGQNHHVSISGGSNKIKYFNSVGVSDNGGLLKSGDFNYKKYNVLSSVVGNITDDLQVTLKMDGILDQKTQAYSGNWVNDQMSSGYWIYTIMNIPTYSVYANNTPPYLIDFGYYQHPIAETTSDIGGYMNIEQKTFQSNLTLDYNVKAIEGLSLKGMFGYYNLIYMNKTWRKKYSVYTYDAVNDVMMETGIQNAPSQLSARYNNYWQTTALAQANYEKTFLENSTFKANLSYERRHQKFDNITASKQFEIDIDQFFAGSSENQLVNSGGLYENDNQNLIGRINYNYSDRYLLQAGFNYGGSSKFPEGKRWGFFPFASAAWRISEEGFFRKNVSFIDQLKLRASWGQAGDDSAAAYQFLTGYTYPSGNYLFDGSLVSGLGFKGAANPNITWFKSTLKNVGVDLNILNNSLSVSLDVFRRDRSGLLATRNLLIPVSVGATLPQENLNSDTDRGFEIGTAYTNLLGDLRYNVKLNLTYTRSYYDHIERAPSGNSYLNWRNNNEGRVKNRTFGYDYIGQFQSEAEILNSPIQDGQGNRTLSPGDLKYRDVNSDGIIDDMDVVPMGGNSTPEYNFSLDLELNWKKFFMTIFFQGAAKYNVQYRGYAFYANRWGRNSLEVFMDRWHHEDIYDPDSPLIPGYYPQTGAINNVPSNHWNSSFWYPSASYLRLKELKVGYTLNNRFIKKIGIQSVDVFVSGWNLVTWHGMKANIIDPEFADTFGWDGNNAYPITTNYYLGLDITF